MTVDPQPAARPPVPSATVVPLRDRPGGGLEVLLVRRADTMRYGGMWAFPGGRVDPGDRRPDDDADGLDAARRTAVREAAEEVGLAFPPAGLVPFSHWIGGAGAGGSRRFAAWYFLAPAPPGTVVIDGSETVDHRWIGPGEAVDAHGRGEIALVAPTWMTLSALAPAGSTAGALALRGDAALPRYVSRMVERGDRRIVLWDGDAGYAAADPDVPGARHRLVMADGHDGWRFERVP